jgi:hypothetical protein
MDFMTVSNSFPVRYELVEIQEGAGPYRAGETWADPSVGHAAELMRRVFEDHEGTRARGKAARRDLEAGFGEESVGRLIRARLAVIGCRHRFSSLKRQVLAADGSLDGFDDLGGFVPRYRKLTRSVREAVRAAVPPGTIVAVISKGDEGLLEVLQAEGRRAWHFPRAEDSGYTGHYPADSREAIAHLETLRAAGAQYLLVPEPALWWLAHYEGLRLHLQDNYSEVALDQGGSRLFALTRGASVAEEGAAVASGQGRH